MMTTPTDAAPDTVVEFDLSLMAQNDTTRVDVKTIPISASMVSVASVALNLPVSGDEHIVAAGEHITLKYTIWNNATRQDIFAMRVDVEDQPGWIVHQPTRPDAVLNPGATTTFEVVVEVPVDARADEQGPTITPVIESKRSLLLSISHELRTPLTRLRLQTELLLEDGVPQKQLNRLNEDIDELDSLVEILLASAKLEQGSVALRITTVDVKSLIMEALSKVELGDRYVRLELPEEPMIQGDKQLLLRAVTNLLSNIQRYTPQDCTVSIQAKRDDKALHMTISDTGEGVSEEFLSRLFLPFEREEKSRSKATGGLGLGLMLVQKVVKAHNGTIEACINSPQGLSIAIVLPNAH